MIGAIFNFFLAIQTLNRIRTIILYFIKNNRIQHRPAPLPPSMWGTYSTVEFVPETISLGDISWSGLGLGFIVWGRSSKWLKASGFQEGSRGMPPPRNFLKLICTEMQSGAFWDTILRNVTVGALTSPCLDDFSDIVTYIYCNDNNIFFGGGGGIGESWAFWGEASTSQIT